MGIAAKQLVEVARSLEDCRGLLEAAGFATIPEPPALGEAAEPGQEGFRVLVATR